MPTRTNTETSERADAEILKDVKRKLKADFEVPDDRIVVKVQHGLVTIEGIVGRDAQKTASEDCVKRVKGIRGVVNKIAVEPAASLIEG